MAHNPIQNELNSIHWSEIVYLSHARHN